MKLLKSKRFWLIILTLIVIGVLIYFIFFRKDMVENGVIPSNGESEEVKDKTEPASQIRFPDSGSWYGKNFVLEVLDEDLESGLDFCEYKIITYDSEKEYSTDWLKRKCNSDLSISVGERKMCGFEGKNACWIYVRSKDTSNNQHSSSLENKSIVYLHIDWTKPVISKVFIVDKLDDQAYPIFIEKDESYNLKTKVNDNLKITGCNLYIDYQDQGIMLRLDPGCQKECSFTKEFIPKQSGVYEIFAACKDNAGNISKSETIEARTNLAPEILFCRVSPVSGSIGVQFNFSVDVQDPDDDSLSFSWNFGDEEFSNVKDAVHFYENPGIYEPEVIVSDDKGASDSCSTAWVSISKD
ncbi:MAG: PKD domain-containing protein [Candidatus Nealsonbacteria bacterium]